MDIATSIEETLAAIKKLIEQKIAVHELESLQKSVEQLKQDWANKKLTQETAALTLYRLQQDLLGTARVGLTDDRKISWSQHESIVNHLNSLLESNLAFKYYSFSTDDMAPPQEHHTQKAKPPQTAMPEMAGAEPPEPQSAPAPAASPADTALPAKGKILYDIPDSMKLNKQQKCMVRIAKDELTAKDSDTFTDAVKVEDIVLSGVMKVELIDIAEPAHFSIKTISSSEQEVDADSYTEWLFWVTPLLSGVFDLILKVSIIKTIDGKERRKDLVFEKAINIAAADDGVPMGAGLNPVPAADTSNNSMKNLADEKNVAVVEPPAVFISYAHKDKIYFDIFSDNLRSQSGWNLWTDRNIEIGTDWFANIQQSIKDSDFAVLLVSADFISSAFIKQNEFAAFMQLEKLKPGFAFLPVLLRDVDFTRWSDLASLQFFVAFGDEYGIPEMRGKMIPFAKLCHFDNSSQLIPNDNIDTYFKNFVAKVDKDWLRKRKN